MTNHPSGTRIVRVLPTDDAAVVVLKSDPALRFVMGRFEAARYDPSRFGYLLAVEQRGAFNAFARVNGLVIVEGAPTPNEPRPTPGPYRAERISEAERFELAARARRGAAICRIRLAQAKLVAERAKRER